MRTQFEVWTSSKEDKNIPELNLDVEPMKRHHVEQGVYRLVNNAGKSNKYIRLPLHGAVIKVMDTTCLFIRNTEQGFDKLGCIDTNQLLKKDFVFHVEIK